MDIRICAHRVSLIIHVYVNTSTFALALERVDVLLRLNGSYHVRVLF